MAVKRFEKIEEIIKTDEQGWKVPGQDLASLVCTRIQDDLPRVLSAYPVLSSEKPSGTIYHKVVKGQTWQHVGMRNLKEIKQAIVSYGLHSPFVRKMMEMWASSDKATPYNWLPLVN